MKRETLGDVAEDFVAKHIIDEFLPIPENIYFILGSGKTTAAGELARRFGCSIYHTDDSRAKHPTTTMDDSEEWLTKHSLKLRKIGVTGVRKNV